MQRRNPRKTLVTTPTPTTADFYTQSRIRLNAQGARLLERLLNLEERRLRGERAHTTERALIDRELATLRRVRDEVYRAMEDRGW